MDDLRIGVDIDGVLANFTEAFANRANRLFPEAHIPNDDEQVTSWNWAAESGRITKQQQSEVWEAIKATENFWIYSEPYAGNVLALQRFLASKPRAHVYYITSRVATRGLNLLAQTTSWLQEYFLHRASTAVLPVVHNDTIGGVPPKRAIVDALGITAMIDDYLPTVHSLLDKGVLLDRPWNQKDRVPGVRVVKSLAEFLENPQEAGR